MSADTPQSPEARACEDTQEPGELTEVDVIAAVPRSQWKRLLLMALGIAALLVIAELTGLRSMFSRESLRELADGSGILGFLAFIGIYAVGNFIHVPGMVFIFAASAAYGPYVGFLAAYLGGFAAVCISFVIVRRLGGNGIRNIRWGPARKILDHLELRPIATMVGLRILLAISPPLNYALALSAVRFRDYVLASALGLIVPVMFLMFAFELVMQWL